MRFLAVLELFKQGVVDLEQVESFGDLMVRPLAAGERVALDLSSLEEWGDDDRVPSRDPGDVEADVDEADAVDDETPSVGAGAGVSESDAVGRHRDAARGRGDRARGDRAGAPHGDGAAARGVGRDDRRAVRAARGRVRGAGPRLPARPGRGRLPLPDPSRRVRVRRAVRARRSDRAALGPGARDAGDHRLQAAGVAGAALGDSRRERRRDVEDARRARLRRRDRARSVAGQPVDVRDVAAVPRTARPRTRSPIFPRSPTSCPRRRSSKRSSAVCCSRRRTSARGRRGDGESERSRRVRGRRSPIEQ